MTAQQQTVIDAEAVLFSDLFRQGRFDVPWHQRYYDWTTSDVRALLHDIDDALKEDRDCYFLGAIMLVKVEPRRWEINDGQQRMVTISLICAALCRRFAHEARGSQREGHALRMLFDLNDNITCNLDDAERYHPRVSPPENDEMRYHQMIRGKTIGTNGKLTAAWAEIESFLSSMSFDKAELYFDFLLKKLEVACLRIPQHVDPTAVYETINARGKPLDDLDLIRNFLYSHFNVTTDSERRKSLHKNLERIRTVIPGSTKAPEYMRCHLQCKFGFLRKDNFYRDAKKAIRAKGEKSGGSTELLSDYVFDLTEQVTAPEHLELFRTMTATSPDPDFVRAFEIASGTTNSRRNLAVFLRELRGYKVTQPVVYAMLILYVRETDGRKKKRIAKIVNNNLRRLAAFVLRTAFVAKFEPSHFEMNFSNYAKDILGASDIPDTGFTGFLRDCDRDEHGVLDDAKFHDAMVEARMAGEPKIKQFLLGINSHIQSDARLLNERLCSVEHILPKSPQHWSSWVGFDDVEGADWAHRIGNLTLLDQADNKPGLKANGNFAKKRESYRDSGVALTRELQKYDEWTPTNIEARQLEMARHAVRVWAFI